MKRKNISLRTAIIVPFILLTLLMLTISTTLWTRDYKWLVDTQSERILSALNANTKQKLNTFLSEPQRINTLFANAISDRCLYGKFSTEDIQSLSSSFMLRTRPALPQIGVISYGDENNNFVGIRANQSTGDCSLLLKDSRTNGLLNIYETQEITSKIVASFEDYDPRTRPWYAPVKAKPQPMWSEIYINQDEKQETTISSLTPVFDKKGVLRGVADVDIRLSELHTFLKNSISKGSGMIYIVDDQWRVISDSVDGSKKTQSNDNLDAQLLLAKSSNNTFISASSKYLIDHKMPFDKVVNLQINENNQLVMVSNLDQPSGLNWKVVTVIPEIDIMGDVKARERTALLANISIALLGVIIGSFLLNRAISPILKTSAAAKNIADGKWDTTIEKDGSIIHETCLLVEGFNVMSRKISETITALQAANCEIEQLHADEKKNLEALIDKKTDALKQAMHELFEKEKLASLGSLVSGIAHEINTPLGVAITTNSYLKMLLQNAKEKNRFGKTTVADLIIHHDDMDEGIAIIDRNLERASDLVKSFKQISIEQSVDEKIEFGMLDYIQSTLLTLKPALKQGSHKIDILCDPDLRLRSYPGAFSQIITNLVMNSITHGFEDRTKGEILIHLDHTGEEVVILYSDNGKGIAPEILPKIFDPFFTTKRGNGGSGLGLNIVYNIITNQLGGKIKCKSIVGENTTFKMELPVDYRTLDEFPSAFEI